MNHLRKAAYDMGRENARESLGLSEDEEQGFAPGAEIDGQLMPPMEEGGALQSILSSQEGEAPNAEMFADMVENDTSSEAITAEDPDVDLDDKPTHWGGGGSLEGGDAGTRNHDMGLSS